MDTDKWQSVATVRALIAELRQINRHLESLHEEKKQSETIRTAYEREEDQRNIQPVWLNPVLTKYEEFEGKRKTDGERHYRVQNNLRWAAWAAFFAAAVYAFLTYRAVNVAENSNSLIQKTMRQITAYCSGGPAPQLPPQEQGIIIGQPQQQGTPIGQPGDIASPPQSVGQTPPPVDDCAGRTESCH